MSGTWEALVQHLLPTEAHFPDHDYIFAFLLSARLYVQPHELLGRIFQEVIDVSGSTENSPRSSPQQHVRALVGASCGGGATTTTAFGLTDLSEISEVNKKDSQKDTCVLLELCMHHCHHSMHYTTHFTTLHTNKTKKITISP